MRRVSRQRQGIPLKRGAKVWRKDYSFRMPPKNRLNICRLLMLTAVLLLAAHANAWRSVLYPTDWQPPLDGVVGFETNKLIQDFSYAGYKASEGALPNVAGPIFDVTQPPYNADKTGTSDTTSAIQSAINAAQTAGGSWSFCQRDCIRFARKEGIPTRCRSTHRTSCSEAEVWGKRSCSIRVPTCGVRASFC